MVRRILLAGACAGFALAVAGPVQAQNYKMLGGWSESNVMAYMPGKTFKENAEKASGGKVTITISGPEAVKPFEQMQPVTAGAFDFIYTHGTYHDKGLSGVAEILPFGLERLEVARELLSSYLLVALVCVARGCIYGLARHRVWTRAQPPKANSFYGQRD